MTKQRDGYHNVTTQLTNPAWAAICADAEEKGVSVAKVLNELLHRHYKIPLGKIPAARRSGRKPKK